MRYTFVASIVFFASSVVNTGGSATALSRQNGTDQSKNRDIFDDFLKELNLNPSKPDGEIDDSFYGDEYENEYIDDDDDEEEEDNIDDEEHIERDGTRDFLTGDDPTPTDSHIIVPITASESEDTGVSSSDVTSDAETSYTSAEANTSNESDTIADAETSNESEIAIPAIDSDLVRSTVLSFLV